MNGRQVEERCENETAARNEEMNEECAVRGGTKKLLSELYEQDRTEFFHFLVPLSSRRNCQSPHKSKNLNNAPRSTSFNNLMHFSFVYWYYCLVNNDGNTLSDKSAADGPKSAKKLEALSKTSQCKQDGVRRTCGASLSPSAFFHPRPVGSRLPAGTAVRHHLSPLGEHWRVAAAHKPGERGRRAQRTVSMFQRFTNAEVID